MSIEPGVLSPEFGVQEVSAASVTRECAVLNDGRAYESLPDRLPQYQSAVNQSKRNKAPNIIRVMANIIGIAFFIFGFPAFLTGGYTLPLLGRLALCVGLCEMIESAAKIARNIINLYV